MAGGKYLKEKPKSSRWLWILAAAVLVVAVTATVLILFGNRQEPTLSGSATTQTTQQTTTAPETEATTVSTEPYVTDTASVGVTGDVLMHNPVIQAAKTGDSYDFSPSYEYIAPYYERFDLMIANLEVTLGGTKAGKYQGYPTFNCPDQVVDALKGAGVDLLLTANNHSYDTGYDGMVRTQQVVKEKGLANLGTVENAGDPFWQVQEVGGIRVGMVCYTYESGRSSDGRKQLNGITLKKEAEPLISSFSYQDLEGFYDTVKKDLAAMDAAGAEASMVFIHWGDEYQLQPNSTQTAIAQTLCELGVDVIVGGHPHVIQPFQMLTSGEHTTYCIYSVGNAVSNQSRNSLKSYSNARYTEDGMVFGVEFQKWNDGTVEVSGIHILPTWVNRVSGKVYDIIPLDTAVPVWNSYDVGDEAKTYESYERTMSVIGQGYNECLEKLGLPAAPLTFSPAA